MQQPTRPISTTTVEVAGLEMNVALPGQGSALVLLHGFPHTWQLWSEVIPELALTHSVVAPDLRGLGGTTRTADGYDAMNLARDTLGLLDALDVGPADVVGIDLGTSPSLLLALAHPHRVRRLVVMESLAGPLPAAEAFLGGGAPWWFGFHAVRGLAENVLQGHEPEYLDFFLQAGTLGRGVSPEFRDTVLRACSGKESLSCAFEHYRALPTSGAQIVQEASAGRLTVPTMAVART